MRSLGLLIVTISWLPLFSPNTARAGVLGPTKPSEVVSVRCYTDAGSLCALDGSSGLIGVSVGGNAMTGTFTIPTGQVFVLTSMSATVCGTSLSNVAGVILVNAGLAAGTFRGLVDGTGCLDVKKEFPTGLIVRSPSSLVFDSREFGGSITLVEANANGYFTRDK